MPNPENVDLSICNPHVDSAMELDGSLRNRLRDANSDL